MTTWNNIFFYFLIVIIFGGLCYLLAPVLTPFLLGTLLAYLVNPLVNQCMRLHIPRILSVVIVFILMFLILILLVILLIPLIQTQVNTLIQVIPRIIDWFQQTFLPFASHYLGTSELINVTAIKKTLGEHWSTAGSYVSVLLNTIVHSGFLILEWSLNFILIPVVAFYLLCDWKKLVEGIKDLLPKKIAPTVIKLSRECDQVLGAFFRGQLMVMLFIAVYYSIGLTAIGINIGIILGIILGIISIVPYLGFVLGIVAASIAAYVQFNSFTPVLMVWLLFAVGQVLENFVVTPRFIGDRIGLHPVAVIFAILACGSLFGFFGILLALPIAAVIMVWLRFLIERYHHSAFYK